MILLMLAAAIGIFLLAGNGHASVRDGVGSPPKTANALPASVTVSNAEGGVPETIGKRVPGPVIPAATGDGSTVYKTSDPGGDPKDNMMSYVGGAGNQRLCCAKQLSDGTLLIGGGADHMEWLPPEAKRIALDAGGIDGGASGKTAFLLHVSADLQKILTVVELTKDKAADISRLRSTEVPGQPTGVLFISGRREGGGQADGKKPGYFIARLDANFVTGAPSKLEWVKNVWAEGEIGTNTPWDVGSDGKVVFVNGSSHSYDWVGVTRLTPDGADDVVEDWRLHWYPKGDGGMSEWQGTPASKCPDGKVHHSGIVLKTWGRGDFRSWTQDEYAGESSDGNGGVKKGGWPYDLLFSGPYNPQEPKSSPKGRGYTGYGWSSTPCGNCAAVVIDRRNNHIYLGGNSKSVLPDGKPDFEPYVIAFTETGRKKWWQRLYPEAKGVSTPDQYCDALEVDYTQPYEQGALVVLARCHGNNVVNLWAGDSIKRAQTKGFQKAFSGKNGNIHIQWLGRMTLADGEMLNATYLAEYSEGTKFGNDTYAEENLDGWPKFDSGWPDVNTTRARPRIHVDGQGLVYVAAVGRRVLTTKNAFLKMPNPLREKDAKGQWSEFVRVYKQDLSLPLYSSLVKGPWNWQTGEGGSEVAVEDCIPVPGGLLVVGYSKLDKQGNVKGDDLPTPNKVPWGQAKRTGEMGVLGKLLFAK